MCGYCFHNGMSLFACHCHHFCQLKNFLGLGNGFPLLLQGCSEGLDLDLQYKVSLKHESY
uniref:Uncharacterized protein MANES_11G115700 n=1 Tax=Rhizophora mucronata TaxID=61149 RepID=A0A2P2KIJ2_RHIMU